MDTSTSDHAKLKEFFLGGRRFTYKKGEIVLHAGDTPQGVYYIESGFVKVYSLSKEGDQNIHKIYKPDELFPVIWTFKGTVRNVYYESLESAVFWRVSREDLLAFTAVSPKASRALLNYVVEQLYTYADRLENLEYNNAKERVIYCLLFMAGRFGVREGKKIVIDIPINHQELADLVNLARETASRNIEKLEDKGLITQQKRRIIIEDPQKLANQLGESANLAQWDL